MGSAVLTARSLAHLALQDTRQFHAALTVLVSDELKQDVALCGVLQAFIPRLIVFLHEDDGVLTLGHLQVLLDTARTGVFARSEGVALEAMTDLATGKGIDVHRHEQICLVSVSDVGTLMKGDKDIRLARVDDLNVRTTLLDGSTQG